MSYFFNPKYAVLWQSSSNDRWMLTEVFDLEAAQRNLQWHLDCWTTKSALIVTTDNHNCRPILMPVPEDFDSKGFGKHHLYGQVFYGA